MRRIKFVLRKFRFSRKRTFLLGLLFLLCIGVTVGFAFLNTTLNITGALNLAGSRWDIHFENVEIEEGSVEATTSPTITDNTSISFSTTLNNPGEQYQFTVDLVNDGTYDAKLDSIEITPTLTEEQQEYFNYLVEYTDGGNIQVNDALDAGTSESIKVLVQYKENDDDSKYPGEDVDFNFSVTMNYIQGKGNEVHHTSLYSVLKTAAIEGTYAKEYTGEHHDSFTKEPSKKIYHWYGSNDTNGTAILNKNNVVFANHCWQMIRTTDTGGVKMIYNGEVEDGKCLNTRGNHVGYASRTTQSLSTTYYYGTDYTYDKTNNVFSLSGTTSTGEIKVGEYTCKSTTADGTCAILYLVDTLSSGTTYNVLPLNGNSHYSQFGTLQFNESYDSPTYVGYMYGDVYAYEMNLGTESQGFTKTQNMLLQASLGTSYWYADSIDYGTLTAGRYSLVDPYQISATTDYPNLVGKYTFRSSSETNTATSVYYIAAANNTIMYCKELQYGNLLSAYEPIVFGDSIRDNGDGTYTINNPINVTLSDWYTNYVNYKNKYTCNDGNITCAVPRYTTATTSSDYTYINAGEKIMIGKTRTDLTLTDTLLVRKDEWYKDYNTFSDYKYTCNTDSATCTEATIRMILSFTPYGYVYTNRSVKYLGSSVIWDGTNYTLVDVIDNFNNLSELSYHHYICVSNGLKTCAAVAYVYYYTGVGPVYYITLRDGITRIDKALEDMLAKNIINSTMKSGVDAWYKHYLLEDYDNYIEDTIFCNDRSQDNSSTNGWNPDGGSTSTYMFFYGVSDLNCLNDTDQFSVNNNKAKLTYKVGLMSYREINLLNNANARKTGQTYWLASPLSFGTGSAGEWHVVTNGSIGGLNVKNSSGVRPAVSLTPGTEYTTGDGSMANPYVVES